MRKLICLLIVILLFCLTSCGNDTLESRAEQNTIKVFDYQDNLKIDVEADEYTGILYYYNKYDNTILCPYYSESGCLCRYEDGHIVEVK